MQNRHPNSKLSVLSIPMGKRLPVVIGFAFANNFFAYSSSKIKLELLLSSSRLELL